MGAPCVFKVFDRSFSKKVAGSGAGPRRTLFLQLFAQKRTEAIFSHNILMDKSKERGNPRSLLPFIMYYTNLLFFTA